jgi:hypothetical protein
VNQAKDKLFGGTNPFCNMSIGSTSFISKIKKGTRHPRWEGESFTFPDVNPTVESHLFINVMHKGRKLRSTRKIGGLSVRVSPRSLKSRCTRPRVVPPATHGGPSPARDTPGPGHVAALA